jgi:hypothetical protein
VEISGGRCRGDPRLEGAASRPGCENTSDHRRASRAATSPRPPLTELASRASPSFFSLLLL